MSSCGDKRRFRSKLDAQMALARIRGRTENESHDIPTRAYRCPHCKGWHLTSQPKDPK